MASRYGDVAAWTPAIEVKEREGKLLVTADLPGLKKEDVTVHIEGGKLVIEGERKQEKEEKREGYYRSERSYGKFYRSIRLPEGALIDKAAANFTNGVLKVSVPIPVARRRGQRREAPCGPFNAAGRSRPFGYVA